MTLFIWLLSLFLCALLNFVFFGGKKFRVWLRPCISRATDNAKDKGTPVQQGPGKAESDLVFSTFDKDGDGFITASELEDSFKSLGLFATEKEGESMVEKADEDGDGSMDKEEFRRIYDSIAMMGGEGRGGDEECEVDLKAAFDVFDENGDGMIAAEELGSVLGSFGLRRELEDCKQMIRNVDVDGDGMVSFQEFKKMMMMMV